METIKKKKKNKQTIILKNNYWRIYLKNKNRERTAAAAATIHTGTHTRDTRTFADCYDRYLLLLPLRARRLVGTIHSSGSSAVDCDGGETKKKIK